AQELTRTTGLRRLWPTDVFFQLVSSASLQAEAPISEADLEELRGSMFEGGRRKDTSGTVHYAFTDQRPGIHRDYRVYNTVKEKDRGQASDPLALLADCLQALPEKVFNETHCFIPISENGHYFGIWPRNHFVMLHVVMQPNGTKSA